MKKTNARSRSLSSSVCFGAGDRQRFDIIVVEAHSCFRSFGEPPEELELGTGFLAAATDGVSFYVSTVEMSFDRCGGQCLCVCVL